jgi:hypothetical protein
VFTQTGVFKAIGRTGQSPGQFLSRASGRDPSSLRLPVFLRAQNLKPFISAELPLASTPIKFVPQQGKNLTAFGFSADILPLTCQVFLDAERAGVLSNKQKHIAEQCHILIKGFALVGITALIDEATGYQDSRARDALAKILEAFVTKELRRWVSTFPADYYKELFRLQGWQFPTLPQDQQERPVMVGKITNDIVYARLAPGVREELHRLTPRDEKGRLKNKLFQRLTDDIGHPRLREHLASLVALMRAADDWDGFLRLLDRALPKYSDLPLFDGLES